MVGKMSLDLNLETFEIPNALRELGSSLYFIFMLSYGPPWAHYLGEYQDRLHGGPLGLPDLRCTVPDGMKHKDYRGEVLG
jgi:hypothetical protein